MAFRSWLAYSAFFSLAVLAAVFALAGCKRSQETKAENMDPELRRAKQLLLDQMQNDQRIWTHEVEALQYEETLNILVDKLRFSSNRLEELKGLSFGELRFRQPDKVVPIDWDVEETWLQGALSKWSSEEWKSWIALLAEANTTIDYFSLQLSKFRPGDAESNGLDRALVTFECHAKAPVSGDDESMVYHTLKGELAITWDRPLNPGERVGPMATVTVEDLRWRQSSGGQAFKEKRRYVVGDPDKRQAVRITPVIVKDLDGDQLPEIILGGVNLLLRNHGDFQFENELFLPEDHKLRSVAALADFTGDGHADVLGFHPDGSLILIEGDAEGRFTGSSTRPWSGRVHYPSALAVADVDGDGDLDVWMTQHRPTYHGGVLPSSIVNANDAFPSYLLRNQGDGSFVDATAEANLGAQRSRRTTASAFFDFDDDGDADLLVISDYAGIEMHENNGEGVFTNVTEPVFGQWHMLGLCAAVGRLDGDDRPDIFAGGRWSLAMHRMDDLRLERADFPDHRALASQVASGNQLFLSQRNYEPGPFNRDAKETGWTTSATAADFDNDSDDDLYLTAGHMTGQSVSDFDSQFWRHDIFLAEAVPQEVLETYFKAEVLSPRLAALRRGEISWYGYESNRLQVNGNDGFADLGYHHGVALHQDSPAALAADLNNDGRMDLLTIVQRTFPSNGLLAIEQSLVIHENVMETGGHWLGVHLAPNAPGFTTAGASVRLVGSFGTRRRFLHTGLTPTVQGPDTAHFGLGKHDKAEYLIVRWGNGHEQVIVEPELDRYHTISPRLDFTPVEN